MITTMLLSWGQLVMLMSAHLYRGPPHFKPPSHTGLVDESSEKTGGDAGGGFGWKENGGGLGSKAPNALHF